ncbi:MAG: mechanosensitive ion channel [Mycobacterium sp.]|nr:mechanosensitive ion channel [Mycobacterium sp.]
MAGVFASSWFHWAVGIAVGLPVALILLTEWQQVLRRRGSILERPVTLLRNFVLPVAAVALLMLEVKQVPPEATSTKVVGTVLAFAVLVLLLSGLSAALFRGAPVGSWRRRIPAIFVDVARLALIAIGLGFIFAKIWGADVGGLFAALGVTSIVVGLMLQNSVGQVISGLLVLFEQPFEIGDWLQTPDALGEVVEVNWRSVHLETDNGLQVTPNSALADVSFTNLSRPVGKNKLKLVSVFSIDDRPDKVCAMLSRVAAQLPQRHPDVTPDAIPLGGIEYETSIRLRSASDWSDARANFLRWIWYASRREGLHLDEADDIFPTPEEIADAVERVVAPVLRLSGADKDKVAKYAWVERYGAGEPIQRPGEIPETMTFIVSGRVQITADASDGTEVPLCVLDEGSFLGQRLLTRQPVIGWAYADDEVTVVQVGRERIEEVVYQNPILLQELGRTIEERRTGILRMLAATDQ